MKQLLTLDGLEAEARDFVIDMSTRKFPSLFGASDGKAVGTFVEHEFHRYLDTAYFYEAGNSASGMDFPKLGVDLKVTSVRQPQSSCPFDSASQKVFGIGYHLMVFVYEKIDDSKKRIANLDFQHAVFVDKEHTADYQTTRGIIDILDKNGNEDDIAGFLEEWNLPLDEIGRKQLSIRIMKERPKQGYLTVSNALQWRLQYGRIVSIASEGGNEGVVNLLSKDK